MFTLCHKGKVHQHDGVFLHNANQQNHPDHGDKRELFTSQLQRQKRAHTCGRQGGKNGERVQIAFVQNAQNNIHGT